MASGPHSVISGGRNNTAAGQQSTVSGGQFNFSSGGQSVVGGGSSNISGGIRSTVSGGLAGNASGAQSTIGGGGNNVASGGRSTISGGELNRASADYSAVGGGFRNQANGQYSFVAGQDNILNSDYQTGFGYAVDSTPLNGSDRIFMIGDPANDPGNLFSVTADGNAHAAAGYTMGGADFAEYLESVSGEEIPIGESVVLINRKIAPDLSPIGVISNNPSLLGNIPSEWPHKYLRDEDNNFIYDDVEEEIEVPLTETVEEEVPSVTVEEYQGKQIKMASTRTERRERLVMVEIEIHDAHHNVIGTDLVRQMTKKIITRRQKKINPEWNPELKYVSRSARPEWNIVGLLGQVRILKDAPVSSSWIFMGEINQQYNLYLIK